MGQADMASFHARVYEIVRSIPPGRVTSYGHVAKLAGYPTYARHVGQALRFLQDETVPWQRVLSASGKISPRGDAGEGALRQQVALEGEGVEVVNDEGLGRVSLAQYGWFPEAVAEG